MEEIKRNDDPDVDHETQSEIATKIERIDRSQKSVLGTQEKRPHVVVMKPVKRTTGITISIPDVCRKCITDGNATCGQFGSVVDGITPDMFSESSVMKMIAWSSAISKISGSISTCSSSDSRNTTPAVSGIVNSLSRLGWVKFGDTADGVTDVKINASVSSVIGQVPKLMGSVSKILVKLKPLLDDVVDATNADATVEKKKTENKLFNPNLL